MRRAALAAAALLAAPVAEAGAPLADCLAPLLEAEADAKRAFQRGLAKLIAETAPEHAGLGRLAAELQIALAERHARRAEALARWGSDALQRPEDLGGFVWTEADEARLSAEDPGYAELAARIEFLGSRNNAHPDWPALRAAYGARIAPTPEHAALMTRLLDLTGSLELRAAACFAR